MAPPFPVPPGAVVIKVEEDERGSDAPAQVTADQDLSDMFTKDVQRRLEFIRRRKGQQPSGSAQTQPPPALPVQQEPLPLPLPLPPPPPPPPPPAQHPGAKRLAIGPPPGFAGVRTPPLKQYQRRPPAVPKAAPAQPPHQPAPPNAHHRAPSPPALNAPRAGHAPQPAPGAHGGAAPPVHAVPVLQRRTAPKAPHPAAKKKPTVPCAFCGVLCMTAWHLKQHEKGRKHRNRVAYLAGEMNVRCTVCNVHLSSGLNVEQHNAGKQHLLRLNRGA